MSCAVNAKSEGGNKRAFMLISSQLVKMSFCERAHMSGVGDPAVPDGHREQPRYDGTGGSTYR